MFGCLRLLVYCSKQCLIAQKPPLLPTQSENKATTDLHELPLNFLTLVPCTMILGMRILVMRAQCWMTLMTLAAMMMTLRNHWSLYRNSTNCFYIPTNKRRCRKEWWAIKVTENLHLLTGNSKVESHKLTQFEARRGMIYTGDSYQWLAEKEKPKQSCRRVPEHDSIFSGKWEDHFQRTNSTTHVQKPKCTKKRSHPSPPIEIEESESEIKEVSALADPDDGNIDPIMESDIDVHDFSIGQLEKDVTRGLETSKDNDPIEDRNVHFIIRNLTQSWPQHSINMNHS